MAFDLSAQPLALFRSADIAAKIVKSASSGFEGAAIYACRAGVCLNFVWSIVGSQSSQAFELH